MTLLEQFTGGLNIQLVIAEPESLRLQVSEISSPTQAVILPFSRRGKDVKEFDE